MMKTTLKFLILFCVASLFSGSLYAQKERGVTLGLASNFTNFTPDNYFSSKNWQIGVIRASANIPLTDRLSYAPSFAFGNARVPDVIVSFWDLDVLALQYALTLTKLQPYLSAGAGVNHFSLAGNGKSYIQVNGGIGVNYWLSKKVALNFQTNFDATPSFQNYWHSSLGINFKLKTGPKDSDKDGVPDTEDACPNVKGLAATKGCPDTDGDGIADKDDVCPKEKGTAATKGCPDTDGDGIANAQDKCPTQPGKPENEGCPDTDGDGVIDKNDACPTVAGLKNLAGCPDTDGDGIADKDDACPTVKGPASNKGCPEDRDKDTVPDAEDNCPDVAGTVANKGCPEIKEEEKKQLETALNIVAKRIQFETGSAVIKQVSYKEIDEIVNIMNKYSQSKFNVEGHTDNVGNADKNKALSGKRAEAVKDYITGKGIDASRLFAEGFGAAKPIAPNTTTAGKAQNRRVEVHLRQE